MGPSVRLTTTSPGAFAHQVSKEIPTCSAHKLAVDRMMTVQAMRNVTSVLRNASHFATGDHVPRELHAVPKTTKKAAHATLLCKGMGLHSVQRVSQFILIFCRPSVNVLYIILAVVAEKPECLTDADCPHQLACIDQHCRNPCTVANPCRGNQQCTVVQQGSFARPTVACTCPENHVISSNDYCEPG